MPWYGDYAMEGWANDNNAESWKIVMNNEYTLTLEDMPGWDKYEMQEVPTTGIKQNLVATKSAASLIVAGKTLLINVPSAANATIKVSLFDMQGHQIMSSTVNGSNASINLSKFAAGQYIVKVQGKNISQSKRVQIK